jgi:hypothetical protein
MLEKRAIAVKNPKAAVRLKYIFERDRPGSDLVSLEVRSVSDFDRDLGAGELTWK